MTPFKYAELNLAPRPEFVAKLVKSLGISKAEAQRLHVTVDGQALQGRH